MTHTAVHRPPELKLERLHGRPLIMGILNVTPDSFSDGGRFAALPAAVEHARDMVSAGADIIDIGGESTRPGARPVGEQQELDRVVPIIEALVGQLAHTGEFDVTLSIDTSKPAVMRAAVAAGAGLINDVRALQEPGALQAASEAGVPVCLMHMQGRPADMQADPTYTDVVEQVLAFLHERRAAAVAAGIPAGRVLLDPGFGFGKRLEHNLALFAALPRFAQAAPVLVGVSRKGMIGELLDDPGADRMIGSVTAALMAARHGAAILRVHDVRATAQALAVWHSLGG